MRWQRLVVAAWGLGMTADLSAQEPAVTAVVAPGQVGLRIMGEPFAVFQHGPGLAKPYWFPVRAPGGHVASALAPYDHKHHKGIWIGVEKVNGNNFWGGKYQQQDAVEPSPAKERIETINVEVTSREDAVQLTIDNDWQGDQGQPVLRERTVVTTFADRLMVFDITLSALDQPVTFEDTKEGFLAIRVAPTMNAKGGGGTIINSHGDAGEDACWGKTAAWVDYSGPVDGKTVGVTLMDHPGNVRPSRYHVRGYGLFAVSPFGEKVYSKGASEDIPLALAPRQSFRVKYGLLLHTGDAATGKVAEAYETFLQRTK
jgi:hypothetical protein